MTATLQRSWAAAQRRWQVLSTRERALLRLAGATLSLLLVWTLLVQPALTTRRQAPAAIDAARAALRRDQALAHQLATLRGQPAAAVAAAALPQRAAAWMTEHQQPAPPQPLLAGVRLTLQRLPAPALLELARTARQQWGAPIAALDLQLDGARQLSGSVDLQPRQDSAR